VEWPLSLGLRLSLNAVEWTALSTTAIMADELILAFDSLGLERESVHG